MKIRSVVFCFIASVSWLGVIIYCAASTHYHSSFEHAQYMIDNNRRIPLWYPWEISEDHFEDGARLVDWRSYSSGGIGNVDKLDLQQLAVSRVRGVKFFNVGTNFIYGVIGGDVSIDPEMTNRGYSQRYFLFVKGLECPSYFNKKEIFLSCCMTNGIDDVKFKSFNENFATYFNDDGSMSSVWNYWLSCGITHGQLIKMVLIWLYGTIAMVMVSVMCQHKANEC